jgi:hypothetical protein
VATWIVEDHLKEGQMSRSEASSDQTSCRKLLEPEAAGLTFPACGCRQQGEQMCRRAATGWFERSPPSRRCMRTWSRSGTSISG